MKTQILYIEIDRFNKFYPYDKFSKIIIENNMGKYDEDIKYLICTTAINIQQRTINEINLNVFFQLCRENGFTNLIIY
jgi:hypothetical protein